MLLHQMGLTWPTGDVYYSVTSLVSHFAGQVTMSIDVEMSDI